MIIVFIVFIVGGIPVFKGFLKYKAIRYSTENNLWYVESDTIEKKDTIEYEDKEGIDDEYYFVKLKKFGRVNVSEKMYIDLSEGEPVYVVIVKGKLGGTYATNQIYSKNVYFYK